MKNQNVFLDYDMVVSVSKRIINQEMAHLTRMGTINPRLVVSRTVDDDGNFVYVAHTDPTDPLLQTPQSGDAAAVEHIDCMFVPQIEIEESGSNVTLVLKFLSGTAYFARGMALKHYDMKGWKYGIAITLDLKAVEREDIGKKIKVPNLVSDQLYRFMDSMFSINHLFMDFESADLMRFVPAHTSVTPPAPPPDPAAPPPSTPGQVGEAAFVEFMQFYLTNLVAAGNPFVLGYSLTTDSSTKYPDDANVPDELKPVGTTYSVYYDPDPLPVPVLGAPADAPVASPDPRIGALSNVNFVLATKGGKGAILGSPGNFDTNWLSRDDQCDAKMIYSHTVLVEKFILQPFYETFSNQIYNGDPNDQDNNPGIHNNLSVKQGNTYAQGRAATDTGFNFIISDVASGDEQYTNSYTVDITNDAAAKQTTLAFTGTMWLYKKTSTNLGVTTATADASMKVTWSGTVVLSTVKNAQGEPTLGVARTFKVDSSTQDDSRNEAQKIMTVFAKALGFIMDLFTAFQDQGYFTKLFEKAFAAPVPDVGTVSTAFGNLGNTISTVLILPAGSVYYFKNPTIDVDANLSMLLTYKSDNAA